jgi:CheY-like chemotaxis protein
MWLALLVGCPEEIAMVPLLAIVENNESTREVLDLILTEEGYRTLLLAHGAGAHEAIRQAQPDLIILDVWLEQQDTGWLVLEQLCADPATRHLDIIVCSSDADALREQELRLRELGAVAVPKPFELEALLAAVRQALGPWGATPLDRGAGPVAEALGS